MKTLRRQIFSGGRITWGSLIGVFLGWTLTYIITKFLGWPNMTLENSSYGFIILTGLIGSVFLLLIAFIESRFTHKP